MTKWAMAIAMLLGAATASAQDRVRLEVYSTLEIENLNDFKKSIEAENPDIEILEPRFHRRDNRPRPGRAERTARRCRLGSAVTSMLVLDKRGLLEPYAPKNLAAIKPAFRDLANPPAWVGMEAWVALSASTRSKPRSSASPSPRRRGG